MRKKRYSNDEAEVDMTPMLDIVFIMLIFFIVTAIFLDEQGLSIKQAPDPTTPPTNQDAVTVRLDAEDMAFIDGVAVRLAAVPLRVESLRGQKANLSVLLSANAQTSVDALVYVKDQLDATGVPITIKVEAP